MRNANSVCLGDRTGLSEENPHVQQRLEGRGELLAGSEPGSSWQPLEVAPAPPEAGDGHGETGQEFAPPEPAVGPEPPQAEPRKAGPNLKPLLIEVLQTVLLTLIIFLSVRSVVQNFKVDGASMEPTLHSGQYLLINKLTYFHIEGAPLQLAERFGLFRDARGSVFPFGGPHRGDIIVFIFPGGDNRDFIKRVIGLPGDLVQVDRGRVYVNGAMLQEDYIRALPSYNLPPQRVPEGNYFVLGDNRPNSSDSHIWGFVPEAKLIGKAWLSYWPPDEWGVLADRGIAAN